MMRRASPRLEADVHMEEEEELRRLEGRPPGWGGVPMESGGVSYGYVYQHHIDTISTPYHNHISPIRPYQSDIARICFGYSRICFDMKHISRTSVPIGTRYVDIIFIYFKYGSDIIVIYHDILISARHNQYTIDTGPICM